jgi:NTE family protein
MAGQRRQPGPESPGGASSERAFLPFPSPNPKRLAVVCAGGGVTGAFYEIGALAALEDRLENVSITDFDVFVGVSAGAYISALLANGVTPGVLFRNVTRSAGTRTPLDDLSLFRLNVGEIATRLVTAPFTVLDATWDFYKNRKETTLTDLVQSLGQLLPSGVFHNEGLEEWMRNWLTQPGRTDDFRRLGKTLRLVAVDLDSGKTTAFGSAGFDGVPISKAVAASCAIPGLYRPVRIGGVDYIDGGVSKTAHISLALRQRCGLTICVNPLVPVRIPHPEGAVTWLGDDEAGPLRSRGLPTILDQVFRVTLHSRLRYGLKRYRKEDPDADIVVFEPRPEDLPRFMHNIMRTSGRVRIAEYAYRSTMALLDSDFRRFQRLFAKHGLTLRPACARDLSRVKISADRTSERITTRLSASLAALEADLERRSFGVGTRRRS